MRGNVYLLMCVDETGKEKFKIGSTKRNVETRLRELQTGNSNVISVLNFYKSDNYKRIEHWLHGDFANQKTEANNEWFILTSTDILNFVDNCKRIDEIISVLLENNPFYQ